MGAAISNNVAKQITTSSTSIATSYTSKCTTTGHQLFDLKILSGCQANGNTVNITNEQVLGVACIQNATTQASMTSDIQAQIAQQALAAAQSIGGPSLSIASSISEEATRSAQEIVTLYTQTCVANENQETKVTCSDGSQFNGNVINISNDQSTYNSCVSNASTIADIQNRIAGLINQQTSAQEANTLVSIVVIGLIVLAFFGIFFVYSINGPIGWLIVGILFLLIIALIVYAIFAFMDKLYPFNQGTNVS